MAFQIPTLGDLRKVTLTASTPISFTVMNEETGKEETYKTKLVGDCDDSPAGLAKLAGKQDKVAQLARVEKTKHANGKLVAGKVRPIVQSQLEAWLLRYVEAAAQGDVIVDASGAITPAVEPEKKTRRKTAERGGVDPALIPAALPMDNNGEAGK